jgi:cytoskeletal protein RodZ
MWYTISEKKEMIYMKKIIVMLMIVLGMSWALMAIPAFGADISGSGLTSASDKEAGEKREQKADIEAGKRDPDAPQPVITLPNLIGNNPDDIAAATRADAAQPARTAQATAAARDAGSRLQTDEAKHAGAREKREAA